MKISLDWLRDFIDIKEKDTQKIRSTLTINSAEVESIEEQGALLRHVLLAKVEKLEPHPNADKLKLATVSYGKGKIKVVCGGSNLREHMKIAFAPVGAVVQLGGEGGQIVALQKVTIRGVESAGMICASTEIGLGELFPLKQEKEIMDLSHIDAPLGTPLHEALGLTDTVINIENAALTHRSDLFSHRGIAREFVANGLGKWKRKTNHNPVNHSIHNSIHNPTPINVTIRDPEACSRYCAVYITGIQIAESPEWMKKRLSAIGIRPISNIVDITNYVMMELGMPLHAFDVEQLKGKNHVMRLSKKGEKVVTLDQKEWTLPEGVVVLADEKEIYDLCGIMGGYQSGIKMNTHKIWLHAPVFNGSLVRKASRALGHHSEASNIYEKGVTEELGMEGLQRAIQLILEICPGATVASAITDQWNVKSKNAILPLRMKQIERLLGVKIPAKKTKKILTDLEFQVRGTGARLSVAVPWWRRKDVAREADLIEEVGRIHGYNNIPVTLPVISSVPQPIDSNRGLKREIKNFLTSQGFNELCTFAFLGQELMKKTGLATDETFIEVANPISADLSIMRQSLLPRTLETIEQNLRYQETFRVFELTRTHFKKEGGVHEPLALIAASVNENLRELQGIIKAMLEEAGYRGINFKNAEKCAPQEHPGRTATIIVQGKRIGALYELHPKVARAFDLKARVVITEIDFEQLKTIPRSRKKYAELDRFPSVVLDVSLLIPRKSMAHEFEKIILSTDKQLIKKIALKDEYMGENIPEGKRSLTFSVTYRLPDRTLTDEEVKRVHDKVLSSLKNAGAEIR